LKYNAAASTPKLKKNTESLDINGSPAVKDDIVCIACFDYHKGKKRTIFAKTQTDMTLLIFMPLSDKCRSFLSWVTACLSEMSSSSRGILLSHMTVPPPEATRRRACLLGGHPSSITRFLSAPRTVEALRDYDDCFVFHELIKGQAGFYARFQVVKAVASSNTIMGAFFRIALAMTIRSFRADWWMFFGPISYRSRAEAFQ
jgi:hypothetical protein